MNANQQLVHSEEFEKLGSEDVLDMQERISSESQTKKSSRPHYFRDSTNVPGHIQQTNFLWRSEILCMRILTQGSESELVLLIRDVKSSKNMSISCL